MTNADRIRQMSDEELASWYVIKCTIMMKKDCQKPYKTCKDVFLNGCRMKERNNESMVNHGYAAEKIRMAV